MITKQELRQQLLSERLAISKNEWREKCTAITTHIIEAHFLSTYTTFHVFVPLQSKNEVDTLPLIRYLLLHKKSVVVPVMDYESRTMIHSKIDSTEGLEPNRWGIPEPVEPDPISIDLLDVVFVPLIAADKYGNRIGYGKGFYDRFLRDLKVPAFGLVFDRFILDTIPSEDHDIPLTGLISESGITICNKEKDSA